MSHEELMRLALEEAGSEAAFVDLMNEKAAELGMSGRLPGRAKCLWARCWPGRVR